ncbi:MAG: FtsH protease activity modulator HflK, partial [Gammaproteobacteria bacterium]|nr:FtsH protease activity modulator HflK [Gammaproteobacteria bacterium]
AKDYVLEMSRPEAGLHHATESALRHVVGSTSMSDVITEGREVMGQQVHVRLQNILDRYQSGLEIRKVSIQDSDPPKAVKASFDDVIKAKEDKERLKNEAESYSNSVVPEARGFAQRQFEEASAYKEEVVARAEGESSRFKRVLVEYEKAPKVTRQRLYLETMESVLSNTTKVMIDVDGGNNMIYLPLDKIMSQSQNNNRNQSPISVDPETVQNAIRKASGLTDRARNIEDMRRRELR